MICKFGKECSSSQDGGGQTNLLYWLPKTIRKYMFLYYSSQQLQNGSHEATTKIILWLMVTTRGAVLKGGSIKKGEIHCNIVCCVTGEY